ncbi:MAG: hypothetical protein VX544_04990 [Pseudomonadota bacterium]|nr:hypothetical protein [Pseudomonadota bacterium]
MDVPKNEKDAWLAAEKESWEPWLMKQKGFVKRERKNICHSRKSYK